jgi:hypothetical protein
LTPAVVHFGHAATVRDRRQGVLAAAYAAHPERFVKGISKPADLPEAVWINPLQQNKTIQDAPGTTITTSVDLQDPLISHPGEHAATARIDLGATRITSPGVSMSLTASPMDNVPYEVSRTRPLFDDYFAEVL